MLWARRRCRMPEYREVLHVERMATEDEIIEKILGHGMTWPGWLAYRWEKFLVYPAMDDAGRRRARVPGRFTGAWYVDIQRPGCRREKALLGVLSVTGDVLQDPRERMWATWARIVTYEMPVWSAGIGDNEVETDEVRKVVWKDPGTDVFGRAWVPERAVWYEFQWGAKVGPGTPNHLRARYVNEPVWGVTSPTGEIINWWTQGGQFGMKGPITEVIGRRVGVAGGFSPSYFRIEGTDSSEVLAERGWWTPEFLREMGVLDE